MTGCNVGSMSLRKSSRNLLENLSTITMIIFFLSKSLFRHRIMETLWWRSDAEHVVTTTTKNKDTGAKQERMAVKVRV